MANEYSTVAVLKSALGISVSTDDTLLAAALSAASRGIDRLTGRRFYLDGAASARVYRPAGRIINDPDGQRILIDDIGDTTGLVVKIGSGTTFATTVTNYETGPDNAIAQGEPVTWLLAPYSWWVLTPLTRIQVTAKWGWPAVPDEIVQATLIQAARLYKRKNSPEGVAGSAEWGVIRLGRVDPDVQALIAPFVTHGFGGGA